MKKIKVCLSLFVVTITSVTSWLIITPSQTANAAFDPNNIMSDAVFDDEGTMSTGQIQAFLNGFPNSCLANYQAPYPNDYFNYGGNVSAATVIRRVADLWHMNPRVILVTLEKEEGLVSGGSGCADWRYNSAVGMGCPDGGQCPAPEYAGFSKQVTKGMWQLQFSKYRSYGDVNWGDNGAVYYAGFMTAGLRARAAGQPAVSYDGYATIDGSSVYMSNGATAALYTYTPHFNGNQHFVTIFNQWFGSTQVTSLVRTVDNATIYLVTNDKKYPIPDITTFNALYPLGGVSFVSQSYLNSKTTGTSLGRSFITGDGTVYFFDAGIKLPFSTCTQVADYGYSCGSLPLLTDYQANALYSGPRMTNVFGTTSSKRFYIASGQKREVYDNTSLTQSGISTVANVLNEAALNNLPYGNPLIRDNVFVKNRNTKDLYVNQTNSVSKLDSSVVSGNVLTNNPPMLDQKSMGKIDSNQTVGNLLKVSGGASYIITESGKKIISDPAQWDDQFTLVPQQIVDQIVGSQTVSPPYFIKTKKSGTIYLLANKIKRPITSMQALFTLAKTTNPTVLSVTDAYASSLTTGAFVLNPADLVKSPTNATVYMVDGLGAKVPLTSFSPALELGVRMSVSTFSDDILSGYATASQSLGGLVTCNGQSYIAVSGKLYHLTADLGASKTLDDNTCNALTISSDSFAFLLGPNGTIYEISGDTKHPIGGYNTYVSHGGNGSNTLKASDYVLGLYKNGSAF